MGARNGGPSITPSRNSQVTMQHTTLSRYDGAPPPPGGDGLEGQRGKKEKGMEGKRGAGIIRMGQHGWHGLLLGY